MLLDVKKFYSTYIEPKSYVIEVKTDVDSFEGFTLQTPACVAFEVKLVDDMCHLSLSGDVTVNSECARCLKPVSESFSLSNKYVFGLSDLQNPDCELTFTEGGKLDLNELAVTEILGCAPLVFLCSENCKGLCQYCGKPKAQGCSCEQNPVDERLAILKQLLS
ncbi:MAG: YceD family protein [Oscillospiraceae bacterium]|nr:YceD family protein [Oscillospiraceae bacterium]